MQRLISNTRRNHAIEHATVAVLLERFGLGLRVSGRATPSGFYLYGDVPTDAVRSAAEEALRRLRDGQAGLAVSPLCGTNLVVAALLATVAGFISLGPKRELARLPQTAMAVLGAMLLAQPLGRAAQRHITTAAAVDGASIVGVTRRGHGSKTAHRIEVG